MERKEYGAKKVDDMENQIHTIFQAISDNDGIQGVSTQDKMQNIVQTMQHYKD
jgi:TATA-box binding protein (TBP) (component of TFIID and TFIIIB)